MGDRNRRNSRDWHWHNLHKGIHVVAGNLNSAIRRLIEPSSATWQQVGDDSGHFLGTLWTVGAGLFASVVDRHPKATNIFDVWLAVFPEKKDRIHETWKKIEPTVELVRRYRDDVAFHGNKSLRRYIATRRDYQQRQPEVSAALQEFWELATELIEYEKIAIPDLRKEIEPALKKAFPQSNVAGLEGLKDYFCS